MARVMLFTMLIVLYCHYHRRRYPFVIVVGFVVL